MSYQTVALGTTFCPDTSANRREFEALKARMLTGPGLTKLQQQIRKENKRLKELRVYLPGYGPRF